MVDVRECRWDELLARFPDDRYLRYDVDTDQIVRAAWSSTGWSIRGRSAYWSADWVTIWSTAADDATKSSDLEGHYAWQVGAPDGGFVKGVTVTAQVPAPSPAPVEAANDWSWFWVDAQHLQLTDAPAGSGADVVEVSHHDPRLLELLTHSPTASHERGGVAPTAWFGIIEDGELLSVAAVKRQAQCTVIQSVVTHRDARGRGLSTRVCGHATVWGLQHSPTVALGMMTDNTVAEHMYTRLGFICEKRWQSIRFLGQ